MSPTNNFQNRLESKVDQQLANQNVGYLFGAGASYLNGKGYPLAAELWKHIKPQIRSPERDDIQAKLEGGAQGIEEALDLLDDNAATEKPHRHLVTEAIAAHFLSIVPPLEFHQTFVSQLALRQELRVPIYCLNYDGLVEQAREC